MQNLQFIFHLLRVKQWAKNSFIFFPLLFSGRVFADNAALNCIIAFAGFCLISSGLYVFNDYRDRYQDRLHPDKSRRPLAQSEINKWIITILVVALIALGLMICGLLDPLIMLIGVIYIGIHLIYNFYTKNVVLLDSIFVAFGFQIRIWVGAIAAGVVPSVWLQLCVFLLALFLGFSKRRHELYSLGNKAAEHRQVLEHYNAYLLDQILIICSTLAIVFYGLYTISPEISSRAGGNLMVYSVVFVIYGIFRYLYLIHVKKMGGDPSEILTVDGSSLINVLLWILFISIVIYNPWR